MRREEIIRLFPGGLRQLLQLASWEPDKLQEIRLRIGKPLILWLAGQEFFLTEQGMLTKHRQLAHLVSMEELRRTMEYLGEYSLYAYETELRQGFLTIQGGHRVGIVGKTIIENQQVKGVQQISGINIRFAHEVKGCADKIFPFVVKNQKIHHTLIISPPRCGKTTLLRDLVRQISDGTEDFAGCTVGVVDERSEIGGSYQGIPQNDVGIRTDLLDCCPKSEGMMMLIRSMSPAVIAVDEIGNYEDIHAMETALCCGCKLLATVHGNSIEEIRKKPLLERLIKEHAFERYIILRKEQTDANGTVSEIFDANGLCLYERSVDRTGTCCV